MSTLEHLPQCADVLVVGSGPAGSAAALALATCLRRRGVDVRYLGADLPVEEALAPVIAAAEAAAARSRETDVRLGLRTREEQAGP